MRKRPRLKRHPNAEVGYGKPPVANRFKPGQSGNPKGRPKGALNIATVIERALLEPVVVTERGRRRKISKFEVAARQHSTKAATGDVRSFDFLLGQLQAIAGRPGTVPTSGTALSELDRKVMQRLVDRIQGYSKRRNTK